MVRKAGTLPKHLHDQYQNSTLDPEWDLLMEIWITNSQSTPEQRPNFEFIKGHQDKHTPYAELSLKAKLNCEADALASSYIAQHPDKAYHTAPMLPSSKVQLHLSTGTISSKLNTALRLARTVGPLQAHLQKKFEWDEDTFHDIDWECGRRAYNQKRKHLTTLIKHTNDITPIGKRVHRYDPKYPAACPSCPEEIETAQHLIHCNCPARIALKTKIIATVRKTLEEQKTRHDLMVLMLEGLQAVFDGRDSETIHYPDSVAEVASAQTAIGWEHLLRGRLSKSWAQVQQSHLGAFEPRNNGKTWATKIIGCLLQAWLDIWDQCNGDRHGQDQQTRQQALKAQAIREVELLYELKGQVKPEHEWIFEVPLQVRREMKTYYLRAFINSWKTVLEESYQERLATG